MPGSTISLSFLWTWWVISENQVSYFPDRPITEEFREIIPVKGSCMHWGLVNGKTQTHYARGSKAGAPEPDV